MRRSARIVTVTVVALSAMTGSLPATAVTATYGDRRVTAVNPRSGRMITICEAFGIITATVAIA
jgi:hypothetical protein